MIRVSPFHQIELAPGLRPILEEPQDHDYVIQRISQKIVNDQPLIQGELVIAGSQTREEFPLAREYPVHFRKTYYPVCFHMDPAREYENHLAASQIISVPPPIGSTRTSFRSCFLPGRPYPTLSPFGVEPQDRNIQIGQATDVAALIGLWDLLEAVFEQVSRLHENGFVHGDLFLHNVIVSRTPIGAHLIDFELAELRTDAVSDADWAKKTEGDLRELLTEVVYIQCALGRQTGALAGAALDRLSSLVKDPDRFTRAMERSEKGA